MARDEIIVHKPMQDETQSVEYAKITKKAVTQANGIKIKEALFNKNNSLQITIETTSTTDGNLTVKAGNNFPNAMLGDLVLPLAKSAVTVVQLEDISRFENRDGSIELDFSTGFTGNIWAVAKRAGLKPVE